MHVWTNVADEASWRRVTATKLMDQRYMPTVRAAVAAGTDARVQGEH